MIFDRPSELRIKNLMFLPLIKTHVEPFATLRFLTHKTYSRYYSFSEDLKNSAGIAKAVSGFGILVHWHEPDNLARVVAKVYRNDDAKIPNSVKVNAGLPQKGRSWTVPCFVLKKAECC